jgi:hypothetical protein
MNDLHEQIAKALFKDRGTWNNVRANEFFADYAANPGNLESEIAATGAAKEAAARIRAAGGANAPNPFGQD